MKAKEIRVPNYWSIAVGEQTGSSFRPEHKNDINYSTPDQW